MAVWASNRATFIARCMVLLVAERAISEKLRSRILGWRYSGFSVHNQVRVAADDAEGRKKLAGYMLRAPGGKGRAPSLS